MILKLLNESDSYAYALSKKLDIISKGEYIIKETTLYSAFTRLEKNRYIETYYKNVPSGGPDRKYYHITALGIKYLDSKLIEWEITKHVVDNVIKWREKNE